MNVVSLHDPLPIDVTFFIDPIESPPEFKEVYQKAVEQSAADGQQLTHSGISVAELGGLRVVGELSSPPSPALSWPQLVAPVSGSALQA